jgi:aminoglycoside phosphotransferase (APT) family kinase protein
VSRTPTYIDAPRVTDTPGLDFLLAAVAAENHAVDLTDAVIRSGWENVVVETRDGWIVRFPRPDVDFEREMAILRRLQDRLPVPIPRVEWTGRSTMFAAYRKITGATFDADAYASSAADRREALARSLAAFLVVMHTCLTPAEVAELAIPGPVDAWDGTRIAAQLDRIPIAARPHVEDLLAAAAALPASAVTSGPPVVLHNDFNTSNLVLDAPAGELTGVWDFSCVALGEPALDLRYFEGASIDLVYRMTAAYEELTGRVLSPQAAILANRLEAVSDHLELDQPERIVDTVRGWEGG